MSRHPRAFTTSHTGERHTTDVPAARIDSRDDITMRPVILYAIRIKLRPEMNFRLTPASFRTIHGASFSFSGSGTLDGSMGPSSETFLLDIAVGMVSGRLRATSGPRGFQFGSGSRDIFRMIQIMQDTPDDSTPKALAIRSIFAYTNNQPFKMVQTCFFRRPAKFNRESDGKS